MKMKLTIFSLVFVIAVIGVVQVEAQSRSRGRDGGGERERSDNRGREDRKNTDRYADRGDRDRHDNSRWDYDRDNGRGNSYDRDHHRNHSHERRVVRHVHVHDRYCHRKPVKVHRHYSRPRYVYYRDYDVYYDYTRNVYFSYSGRSWSMTTGVPMGMRHVNLRTVKRYEVDYYDDDFGSYLDNGRPGYGKECDW